MRDYKELGIFESSRELKDFVNMDVSFWKGSVGLDLVGNMHFNLGMLAKRRWEDEIFCDLEGRRIYWE